MRKMLVLGLSVIAVLVSSLGFTADKDPNLKAIKARQGDMQLRSFNAGPLFAMAKGDLEYDAELANTLANNLKLLLEMDMGRAWPQGSHNENYPGKTTALPKIWETYPEISENGKKYAKAVNDLAAVAGNGLAEIRRTVSPLGKSCKACHDSFREKK